MAKIYGYYEYDDSLTPGQSEDGGLSQLLFDCEGKLSDHASFHPSERDDDDSSYESTSSTTESDPDADAQAAALLILAVIGAAVGGYALIRKATPHVQQIINERALPAVRSFWNNVRGLGSEATASPMDAADVVTMPTQADACDDDAAPGTDVAVAKPQMTAEEWCARFRAMFEARQFADEQWKILSSVQVVDNNAIRELQREMARSQPEAIVRRVTLMLEAMPQVDEVSKAEPLLIEVRATQGNDLE
ncbi:hypothetical protein GE115_02800 [Agromyces sp. CFH 90414]|uniref:Uncharacterized protein n=1 Tax=Agromyces agglutinans TaxID=2662258 RepID=A0A6I2F083_9MICO|nr:hypothetical protein [Agromyces agglutinans]MRG58805.1 hypothetical protein [Agromyces agglutinans]